MTGSEARVDALRNEWAGMVCRAGRVCAAAFTVVLTLALAACGDQPGAPRHEVTVPWGIGGTQIVADLHMHSRFSDGALDIESLARKAFVGGCRAVAITDFADAPARGGGKEYLAALNAVRKKYPKHILIGGVEWNVPPHLGRIQLGLLLDPVVEHQFPALKQQLEDPRKPAGDALGWLASQVKEPAQAALIYNHPSRHGERAEQILAEWRRLRGAGVQTIAFEGGPGHQGATPPGNYAPAPLVERWDPAIATVGGAWDQLLDHGESPWGALAFSAYRSNSAELAPCEFSRTVLKVPEVSASGVLKALHAGSFWAAQGRFIDYLLFTVSTPGLELPASPGEIIRVRKGAPLNVRVAIERDPNAPSQPLTVEIIGNCAKGKPENIATRKLEKNQSDSETELTAAAAGADGNSCYLRGRVRGQTVGGDTAVAYTNPVRVRLDTLSR